MRTYAEKKGGDGGTRLLRILESHLSEADGAPDSLPIVLLVDSCKLMGWSIAADFTIVDREGHKRCNLLSAARAEVYSYVVEAVRQGVWGEIARDRRELG